MKLSIGKAWDEASAFLGKEARLVAPVALATFALPSILADWAYPGGRTGGAASGLLVVVLLAVMVGQMTIVLLVNGWRGSVGEAMAKAARRLPIPIAALMIVILPLMLVAIIGFGASIANAGITDPAALTPGVIAKLPNVGWLLLLLTVALIIVMVRFFPIAAIAVSEPIGPIKLLKRSWTLTKGNFWRLFVLVLLLGIIALVLDWAVTAVVGSIATLAAGEAKAFNLSALLVALVSGLVGALVSSVSAAMAGRVYAQLSVEPSVPTTA
ncbi:MAG: DUF975 family protein [Sphingomonas bacterium]|nr:DUF975 family protein [Sphingomonas bacterium]